MEATNRRFKELAERGSVEELEAFLVECPDVDPTTTFRISWMTGGWTVLMAAADYGNAAVIPVLAAAGVPLDARTEETRESALHIACVKGRLAAVEALVGVGADIYAVTHKGRTPLTLAAKQGSVAVVRVLVESGAITRGDPVHDGYAALLLACSSGNVELFDYLLSLDVSLSGEVEGDSGGGRGGGGNNNVGVDYNNDGGSNSNNGNTTTNNDNNSNNENSSNSFRTNSQHHPTTWTPLLAASQGGSKALVERLLVNPATAATLEYTTSSGDTALALAARIGHAAVVELLLAAGANVHAVDQNGTSLLERSCSRGRANIAMLLLEAQRGGSGSGGVDDGATEGDGAARGDGDREGSEDNSMGGRRACSAADATSNTSNTNSEQHAALVAAVNFGHDGTVALLLSQGVNPNARPANDESGDTLLHLAARKRHTDVVRTLVHGGADVSVCNEAGEPPLFAASRWGSRATINILVDAGADVNFNADDAEYPTALLVAVAAYSSLAVDALIAHGADLDARTIHGDTALHVAVRRGGATVSALTRAGADVAALDMDGRTPLVVASELGRGWNRKRDTTSLLAAGANPNSTDRSGTCCMELAVTSQAYDVAEVLVRAGANIKVNWSREIWAGWSLLMVAAYCGATGVVAALLERGDSNVNAADETTGYTALIAAVERPRFPISLEIARMLLAAGAEVNAVCENGPPLVVMGDCWQEALKLFLEYGGDPNSCAPTTGITPLIAAAQCAHGPIGPLRVAPLVRAGASVNCADHNGATALIAAVLRGHTSSALRELLKCGGDPGLVPVGEVRSGWSSFQVSNLLRLSLRRGNGSKAVCLAEYLVDSLDEWGAC